MDFEKIQVAPANNRLQRTALNRGITERPLLDIPDHFPYSKLASETEDTRNIIAQLSPVRTFGHCRNRSERPFGPQCAIGAVVSFSSYGRKIEAGDRQKVPRNRHSNI